MSYIVNDYDFDLPKELIAQTPLEKRDNSKLLVVNDKKAIEHKHFNDIIDLLDKDDVLVLNDTRVIPARLIGVKEVTFAKIELLLLKEIDKNIWQSLVKPAKRIKAGDIISFGDDLLKAKCIKEHDAGIKDFEMIYDGIYLEILDKLGSMPLPPYIVEKLDDANRYQTVYSKNPGSVAAPTAGLHFTEEILNKLKNKNIEIIYVTLHVSLGTFRPVSVDNVLEHTMHSEQYYITEEMADRLNNAVKENKRIIGVGTTTVRVLETVFNKYNKFVACSGETDIFIYPGYEFLVVDSLITNFHLPKSTLMMLISAFLDRESILDIYKKAIEEKYRFFSFGDSMFINLKEKK